VRDPPDVDDPQTQQVVGGQVRVHAEQDTNAQARWQARVLLDLYEKVRRQVAHHSGKQQVRKGQIVRVDEAQAQAVNRMPNGRNK